MMRKTLVVGNGLVATAVAKLPDSIVPVCYFASGVSNSSCCDPNEFDRERLLLQKTIAGLNSGSTFVYFSTCSIYETQSKSMYISHKIEMENIVSQRGNYIIFRLPQVVGLTDNKFTLTNYIANCIKYNKLIRVQKKAIRNIIDVEDVATLAMLIVNSCNYQNTIINIANPFYTRVVDLVAMLEVILCQKANCDFSDTGTAYPINTDIVQEFARAKRIDFGSHYVEKVLSKYYSPK